MPYGAGNLAIFGGYRNLVPLNRGIATPLKRTGLAMTELLRQTPIYRLAASDSGGFEISYRRISQCIEAAEYKRRIDMLPIPQLAGSCMKENQDSISGILVKRFLFFHLST